MKFFSKRLLSSLLALVLFLGSASALAAPPSAQEIDALLAGKTDPSKITSPVIDAITKARQSVVGINIYADPLPPPGEPMPPEAMGIGSGTVVSPWGHVLTNFHVVHNAGGITVVHEEREYDAYLIESAPELDLAVVYAPELKLKPVEFGNSDALQIGEYAIIIGNPLGHDLERSVFFGVVSALKRLVDGYAVEDRFGMKQAGIQRMIQTDAAINPGASGGGLFNILGQLQGVATLKFSEGSVGAADQAEAPLAVDNIGMCVPINDAMPLIRRALEAYDGSGQPPVDTQDEANPQRPRVGVLLRQLDDTFQPRRDKLIPRGVLVEEVDADSPAMKAGLKPGDLLVAWNDQPISDLDALDRARNQDDVTQPIPLTIYRCPGLLDHVSGKSNDPQLLAGDYQELSLTLEAE